jgi:hypothetical protein
MYLELDGQTLQLATENGYHVRSVDFGFPEVRTVTDSRPLADGNDDRTRFFGARAVSLSITLVGNKWTLLDQLAKYLNPAARPFLVYDDAEQPRRIRLRAAEQSGVITSPTNQHDVLVQWFAPDGVSESLTQTSVTVFASPQDEPGFTFDLTFDINFPTAPGRTPIIVPSTAPVYPVLRMFGPAVTPRIENAADVSTEGQPKRLTFDITIPDGDFLEVNMRERTVLFNGRADRSRYSTLDFGESEWWALLSGLNQIRYFPVSYSGSTRAVILFRSTFL